MVCRYEGLALKTYSNNHAWRELFKKNIPEGLDTLNNIVLVRVLPRP